jgi:hypothetical protein
LNTHSTRNLEIDFVKGCLVLTMIIYHTFVNFYINYPIVTNLVKYVSGGFIYISGFLVGFYYMKSYSNDYSKIRKRLMIRSMKIFFIYLIANITLFNFDNLSSFKLKEILIQHFLSGAGKSRFEILLPIGYLLFISALIVPYIKNAYIFLNILMISIFCLIALGFIPKTTNYYYLPIGLFGLGNSFLTDKIKNTLILQMLCFFLVIFIGWLWLIFSFGANIVLYVTYIISVLMTFYNIAKRLNLRSLYYQWILRFGEYILFSYIFHLFIIVTFVTLYPEKMSFAQNVLIVIFVSLILFIALSIVDILRKRSDFINKSYKLIFS